MIASNATQTSIANSTAPTKQAHDEKWCGQNFADKRAKFTAAAITKYAKAQTATQTTPQSPTAWRFQTSLKRREPIKSSWLEESIRANDQNDQIKPIDLTDHGKSAKAKRLVLFIFKKSNDLSLQLEPLAKLHYRMPCVVFAAR